jgi:hypothetical protein
VPNGGGPLAGHILHGNAVGTGIRSVESPTRHSQQCHLFISRMV